MKHALLASVALLTASPALADTPKKPRLFTDAEAAKAIAALKKRLVATKSCPRPVLRGTAKKGDARTELYALFEGKDACGARIDKLAAKSYASGTPISEMTSDPQVLEFEAACGKKLEAAVKNAASRQSACSPYEIGFRALTPTNMRRHSITANLLGQHARTLASTRPVTALQLLLDGVRVFHDLTRGHTNLMTQVIALDALLPLVETAHDILEAPIADPAKLIPLAAELDALLATSPTAHSLFAAEGDSSIAFVGKGVTAEDKAFIFHLGADIDRQVATLCPENSTYVECKKGLDLVPSTVDPVEKEARLMTELAATASEEDARKRTRSALIALARDSWMSGFAKRLRHGAHNLFRLASLRIHLEAVIAKACPAGMTWDAEPWLRLRTPPFLGAKLPMNASRSIVTITAPVQYDDGETYTFKCPTK